LAATMQGTWDQLRWDFGTEVFISRWPERCVFLSSRWWTLRSKSIVSGFGT